MYLMQRIVPAWDIWLREWSLRMHSELSAQASTSSPYPGHASSSAPLQTRDLTLWISVPLQVQLLHSHQAPQ